MATVADLRTTSDALSVTSYPIPEPLNAPQKFKERLTRFGDNYNLSNQSHLYKYLVALCGDTGAGQLKKEMLLPRLEQQLEGTHYGNLDRLYGNPLGLPRLTTEIYDYNPDLDILATTAWDEIRAKDAAYRARCLTWMRAIIYGPTRQGISLAAEAAIGIESDVWERYQYVQTSSGTDFGKTGSINEFVVIPRTPTITPKDARQISRLMDIIKPVNTIGTVFAGTSPRTQRTARLSSASSNFFNVQRLVTGRPDISWPAINPTAGYWISLSEQEAPTLAFMNRQESVTYLSVINVTASTTHIGFFNNDQQQLFSHLTNVASTDSVFGADEAYDNSVAPVNLSIGWSGGGTEGNNIVVNNNYPLTYFANADSLFSNQQQPAQLFWASEEAQASDTINESLRFGSFTYGDGDHWGGTTTVPDNEWLLFDFGRARPVNYVHFEICQKPIDWRVQYFDATTSKWIDIPVKADYPVTMAATYLPSNANPWMNFDAYFDLVQTQFVRILFARRSDPFPLPTSNPISFSVDVRGVRLMHVIPVATDFISDSGVDILGNIFRTGIITYGSDNTTDNTPTYWQSQPNPSRFAVEALYYDLRQGSQVGTMNYLDSQFMDELDTRSMADVETYYSNGQLVDEIYIDPITFGPDMHFYYSDDDTPDWDQKLWSPVPKSYILKRGFHALPRPTFMKYFKIEFSNLTAIPYEPVQYPQMPDVTFRRFPLWVNDYFSSIDNNTTKDTIQQTDLVTIDPLTFGFQRIDDSLTSSYEAARTLQLASTDSEIGQFIQTILDQTVSTSQINIETSINYRSPIMWQSDLIANLDSTRALSRVVQLPRSGVFDTGWSAELTLPVTDIPVQSSSSDMTQPLQEKTTPTMWFSRTCRHYYQITKAPIERKIAYIVGVREVAFYRRDYTAPVDESLYVETLDDTAHIATNDFIQNDWRYVVSG